MKSVKTKQGTELPLTQLKGKDYLTVTYRVLWFREDHPNWSIETDFIVKTPEQTTAKAIVRDEKGFIIATSHKNVLKSEFHFHLEKAETGAIGRALSLSGYGTQFAQDLEDDDYIVDAPLEPKQNYTSTDIVPLLKEMYGLVLSKAIPTTVVKDFCKKHFNKEDSKLLTNDELINLIKWIKESFPGGLA